MNVRLALIRGGSLAFAVFALGAVFWDNQTFYAEMGLG
jgi:hypothetical protein